MDSEGLLLLTDDNSLKHQLTDPKFDSDKTYLVQVDGAATPEAINKLERGVIIEGQKTKPAKARLLEIDPEMPPRDPPIRVRKTIPTSWIQITITEGRNRQVRKMTANVGFPTLRLIRNKIKDIEIGDLEPGKYRNLTEQEIVYLKKRAKK